MFSLSIFGMMLHIFYTSQLTSSLAVSGTAPPFNSLEELLQKPFHKLLILTGTSTEDELMVNKI